MAKRRFAFAALFMLVFSSLAFAVLPEETRSLQEVNPAEFNKANLIDGGSIAFASELSKAGIIFTDQDVADYYSADEIHLIVRYKDASAGSRVQARRPKLDYSENLAAASDVLVSAFHAGGVVENSFATVPALSVRIPRSSVSEFASGARANGRVESIAVDSRVHALLNESVEMIFPQSERAGLEARFGKLNGSGVSIAILDTGINKFHPDLDDLDDDNSTNDTKVVAEKSFVFGENASDGNGHGTHVAGTAAGTGSASAGVFKGVAPQAQLLNGKVLSNSGFGFTSDIIAGVEWAVSQNASVISMSLGCSAPCRRRELEQAVAAAVTARNVVVAIAAGNDFNFPFSIASPGVEESAITVGSVDKDRRVSLFSSMGPTDDFLLKPEVVAPGRRIISTSVTGGYDTMSGTSMATPHVSGAAALLRQARPDWNASQIKAALVQTAQSVGANPYLQGAGLIRVGQAANASVLASPAVVNLRNVFNSTEFNITFYNASAGRQFGVALSLSNLTDLEGVSQSAPASLSETQFCLDANASALSKNVSVAINSSSLSANASTSYAFFVQARVYGDCNFSGEPNNLSVPVAFSKVKLLNLTLYSPAWFPADLERKTAFVAVLSNGSVENIFSTSVKPGERKTVQLVAPLPEFDVLVNFFTTASTPSSFATSKWRDAYAVNGANFTQADVIQMTVNDSLIPIVQQNAKQFLDSQGLEEYAVVDEFIAGSRAIFPLFFGDEGRNVERSREWSVAVQASNTVFTNYSFFVFAGGKPKGVRFFDATRFMVLPFRFAYPFTAISQNVSQQDVGSTATGVFDSMPAGGSQSLEYEVIPFPSEKTSTLFESTFFTQRLPPKETTFEYRKCVGSCGFSYKLFLDWVRTDSNGTTIFKIDEVYNSSGLPPVIPLLRRPFVMRFTLSPSNNFVGNNFVKGFFFDADTPATGVIPIVSSRNAVVTVRGPDGQIVFRYPSSFGGSSGSFTPQFHLDFTLDRRAYFAFVCYQSLCKDGNHTLEWVADNVFNGQNLSSRVVLEWSNHNQEFTVREITRTSQPEAGTPATGDISAVPSTQVVGSNVTVTLSNVRDGFGFTVPDGTKINFSFVERPQVICFTSPIGNTTSCATSSILSATPTTAIVVGGSAFARFTSNKSGEFYASASFGFFVINSTLVNLTAGPASKANIFAIPSSAIAGQPVLISVNNITDASGNRVADGTIIDFTVSRGSIASGNVAVNASSSATLSFNGTGEVTVTAFSQGVALNSTKVFFVSGAPASIALSSSPASPSFKSNATISAFVADGFGNAVANGTPVNFNATRGVITSQNTTFKGVALAVLRSESAGRTVVRAAFNDSVFATLEVLFTANCSITATPSVSQGPFASIVFVNFTESPTDSPRTRISCGGGLRTKNAPVVGNFSIAICRYPQVQADAEFDLTVQAGESSCAKRIRVLS